MRFSLSFDMDGAAFDGCEESPIRRSAEDSSAVLGCGDNSVDEVVRILHEVADKIDNEGITATVRGVLVRDVNGNAVGQWVIGDE